MTWLFVVALGYALMLYIPHLLEQGDLPDITGLAAHTPLLVQQCPQDEHFLQEGMVEAAARLERYYSKSPDCLSVRYYDNPHQFNITMQEDAFDWLDQWMKKPVANS